MKKLPVTSPASLAVFRRILTHGPIARVDISRDTNLSQAAITKAVTPLMEAGFVVEDDGERAAPIVGRPISPLIVARDSTHVLGLKITADRTYGVLTDLGANVLRSTSCANSSSEVGKVVESAITVIEELAADSSIGISGLGVAVSGDVDRESGTVRDSPLLGWKDVPLRDLLQDAVGLPTLIENDVRALTVTELLFGAGRDAESFAVVTLGTGVGCGLYLNGKIVQGAFGVSGELGHLPLGPKDAICTCGRRGCVEAVAASSAILERIRRQLDDASLTVEDAVKLAHSGDRVALEAFQAAGRIIGEALSSLVNLVGPELLVIAGENVTEYQLYSEALLEQFSEHAFGAAAECKVLLRPHLFDDWARGAAACVIESLAGGVAI